MIARWCVALVTRIAHPADRASLATDLAEEYDSALRVRGPMGAALWQIREAIGAVVPLLRARFYRRRLPRTFTQYRRDSSPRAEPLMGLFGLLNESRHAARRLARAPVFFVSSVAILAAALAANATVYALVDAVLLQPLPYSEPDRLVSIWTERSSPESVRVRMSSPDFFDYRDRVRSLADVIAVGATRDGNLQTGGEVFPIRMAQTTPNLFRVLGIEAALGQAYDDAQVSGTHAAGAVGVVSHQLWTTVLGADPARVGQPVVIDGREIVVVGVMPPGFSVLRASHDGGRGAGGVQPVIDIWLPDIVPMVMDGAPRQGGHMRTLPMYSVFGRLAEGVSVQQASAELGSVASGLRAEFVEHADLGSEARLAPLHEEVVGNTRPLVVALTGLVTLVLLVASANLASLVLSRADARTRESAIRAAVGGNRWALIRPLLLEGVWISTIGAALGLACAQWLIATTRAAFPPELARIDQAHLSVAVVVATLAAAVATTLLVGLIPAVRASRFDVARLLTRGGDGRGTRRFRSADVMVVAEVGLSTVLVIAALLMARSVDRLDQIDLGMDVQRISSMRVSLPNNGYRRGPERIAFLEAFADELKALPSVEAAGAVWPAPFAGEGLSVTYGATAAERDRFTGTPAIYRAVTPGFFDAMALRPLNGRLIEVADMSERAAVVVLSASAAEVAFGDGDPVGRSLWVNVDGVFEPEVRVVGVVEDAHDGSLRDPALGVVYFPYGTLTAQRSTWLLARTTSAGVLPPMAEALRRVDANVALADVAFLSESVDRELAPMRIAAAMLSAFGVFAFALACTGLHGVVATAVGSRTREVGIRMALGAQRSRVIRDVVTYPVRLALMGGALGVIVAFQANRLLTSLLFGIGRAQPAAYAAVLLALIGVALVAAYRPARYAVAIEPTQALRNE